LLAHTIGGTQISPARGPRTQQEHSPQLCLGASRRALSTDSANHDGCLSTTSKRNAARNGAYAPRDTTWRTANGSSYANESGCVWTWKSAYGTNGSYDGYGPGGCRHAGRYGRTGSWSWYGYAAAEYGGSRVQCDGNEPFDTSREHDAAPSAITAGYGSGSESADAHATTTDHAPATDDAVDRADGHGRRAWRSTRNESPADGPAAE